MHGPTDVENFPNISQSSRSTFRNAVFTNCRFPFSDDITTNIHKMPCLLDINIIKFCHHLGEGGEEKINHLTHKEELSGTGKMEPLLYSKNGPGQKFLAFCLRVINAFCETLSRCALPIV